MFKFEDVSSVIPKSISSTKKEQMEEEEGDYSAPKAHEPLIPQGSFYHDPLFKDAILQRLDIIIELLKEKQNKKVPPPWQDELEEIHEMNKEWGEIQKKGFKEVEKIVAKEQPRPSPANNHVYVKQLEHELREMEKQDIQPDNQSFSTMAKRIEPPILRMYKEDKQSNLKSRAQVWVDKLKDGYNQIRVVTTSSKLDGSNETTVSSVAGRRGINSFTDNEISAEFQLFKERMHNQGYVENES